MLAARTVRIWSRIHKWTSLVCTAFLLMLCITGLPLIFHEEIDHALGDHVEAPARPGVTTRASADTIAATALAKRPGDVLLFMSWDRDDPNLAYATLAPTVTSGEDDMRFLVHDARTGEVLAEPGEDEGIMHIILHLHVDMFAGLAGKLFLGFMGLLFVVAIVSGIVVYAPFMRRLDFGTVRHDRAARTKWLDLHNLMGVVTIAWALVVGLTGVISTWADLVFKFWQNDQLVSMAAPYQGKPPLERYGSIETAVATAREAAPGMQPLFMAFPGTPFATPHHFMVFMRGETPLTKRLGKPVLVDAQTGALTETREAPWYVTALLISQPLHFGDYGGLPLKIIWAILDVITIVVLGSGLYLWLAKRRTAESRQPAPDLRDAIQPVSAE